MILAQLSTDRLIDENELARMNPPRLDDCAALVGAIVRRRIADLCLIARNPDAARVQQFSQRGLALDCARWLREAGATLVLFTRRWAKLSPLSTIARTAIACSP
jgi:hypothetical protein